LAVCQAGAAKRRLGQRSPSSPNEHAARVSNDTIEEAAAMKEQSSTRQSGGTKLVKSVTSAITGFVGILLALGSGWVLVTAGGEANNLAIVALVVGLVAGRLLRVFK
jgi:hypothetical protein